MKTDKCTMQSKGMRISRFKLSTAIVATGLLIALDCNNDAADGIYRAPISDGAHLRSDLQNLEGYATTEGLWINSINEETGKAERFRVVASALGREGGNTQNLPPVGVVKLESESVNFIRPGVTEEYRVSINGIRQDFLIAQRPAGRGELRLDLTVTGATSESSLQEPAPGFGRAALLRRRDIKAVRHHSPTKKGFMVPMRVNNQMEGARGARLKLISSGREIAYSRLRVFDAEDREIRARMEVLDPSHLSVLVDDSGAVYPLRIDPTFSDNDWASMGGLPGANDHIAALISDDAGNLYAGGIFTMIGDTLANRIAKWDGSDWSPLGSGLEGEDGEDLEASALAILGTDLYVGGSFTIAGNKTANHIAKWDGNEWSPLGTGIDANHSIWVSSLAESGTDLYVAGWFDSAGGIAAANIAKWDGSKWSALGSGIDDLIFVIAASGNNVYAGGLFFNAGSKSAISIAHWDGNTWSPLGSGTDGWVTALAATDDVLYVGGEFDIAGEIEVGNIAKWDGNTWSPLGSGVSSPGVNSLTISGDDLYVGGEFSTAGGRPAEFIAKWSNRSWSSFGSGITGNNPAWVSAIVVSGSDLFVGGNFFRAGNKLTAHIAHAFLDGVPKLSLANGRAIVYFRGPAGPYRIERSTDLETLASHRR